MSNNSDRIVGQNFLVSWLQLTSYPNFQLFSNFRKLGAEYGYSFSIMKTNTELHGIPQRRIRTFYFFWNTPTVPMLTWKMENSKSFSDYLKEIPENATQQNMFKTKGKASERFRPYQFCLQREKLTHRWVKEVFYKGVSGLKIHRDLLIFLKVVIGKKLDYYFYI